MLHKEVGNSSLSLAAAPGFLLSFTVTVQP